MCMHMHALMCISTKEQITMRVNMHSVCNYSYYSADQQRELQANKPGYRE